MSSIKIPKVAAILQGKQEVQFEFLAAKMLLTRLKIAVSKNPMELTNAANELISLLESNSQLASVKKDIEKLS